MISVKTNEQLELMRRAGAITRDTLRLLEDKARAGVSTAELDKAAYEFILKCGAKPSFLRYHGYPASVCISIDEEVVHGIPSKKRFLEEGQIVSFDVGAFKDGYHGDDIKDLARAFLEENGPGWLDKPVAERHAAMARFGLDRNIPKMKADLARYGIQYDEWFFESSLHESGFVADTVSELTERGFTYEKDGALWLATSRILGDELRAAGKSEKDIEKLDLKDDVLRRANGFYTYFAADIAYHRNKLEVRGFDRAINIWGADHHGHVARLKGALDALGLDGQHRLEIVLMQLVKLMRDGEVVRMSKRTGKAISLGDLLDEIPVDAARWFFNSRPDTQMNFDLGLAVREDSENPVYYIQYAYARICSLLKTMADEGRSVPAADKADLSLLSGEQERALIKELANFSEEIRMAARDYDPSYINRYLMRLAGAFHRFYNACRIKGAEPGVLEARLLLADCVRSAIAVCLGILGVHAPEQM